MLLSLAEPLPQETKSSPSTDSVDIYRAHYLRHRGHGTGSYGLDTIMEEQEDNPKNMATNYVFFGSVVGFGFKHEVALLLDTINQT